MLGTNNGEGDEHTQHGSRVPSPLTLFVASPPAFDCIQRPESGAYAYALTVLLAFRAPAWGHGAGLRVTVGLNLQNTPLPRSALGVCFLYLLLGRTPTPHGGRWEGMTGVGFKWAHPEKWHTSGG